MTLGVVRGILRRKRGGWRGACTWMPEEGGRKFEKDEEFLRERLSAIAKGGEEVPLRSHGDEKVDSVRRGSQFAKDKAPPSCIKGKKQGSAKGEGGT